MRMKSLVSLFLMAALLAMVTPRAHADTIVILKWSVPMSNTVYEVENAAATSTDLNDANADGKPYARKTVAFTEAWANYQIHNVITGQRIMIDYFTWYQSATVAIKRYAVGGMEANSPGYLARDLFWRAPSANTAPTYNFIDIDTGATLVGGPTDTPPTNDSFYYQRWAHLLRAAQPITTVIPALGGNPAIKVLLPSLATGPHRGFTQHLYHPGAPGSISPNASNRQYTFESGTTTLSYDSVLTGKSNAALAANVHVFNQAGAEVFPGTLAYAVKLVRDSLEALGYEIETEED
jgi:hypothetical protein